MCGGKIANQLKNRLRHLLLTSGRLKLKFPIVISLRLYKANVEEGINPGDEKFVRSRDGKNLCVGTKLLNFMESKLVISVLVGEARGLCLLNVIVLRPIYLITTRVYTVVFHSLQSPFPDSRLNFPFR